MNKRNQIWLIAVVGIGVLVGVIAGVVWGIVAAVATLVVSEIIERVRRGRLREARGAEGSPSIKDAITSRRKR